VIPILKLEYNVKTYGKHFPQGVDVCRITPMRLKLQKRNKKAKGALAENGTNDHLPKTFHTCHIHTRYTISLIGYGLFHKYEHL